RAGAEFGTDPGRDRAAGRPAQLHLEHGRGRSVAGGLRQGGVMGGRAPRRDRPRPPPCPTPRARMCGALLLALAFGRAGEPPANHLARAAEAGSPAESPVAEPVDARCALPDRPTAVHRTGADVLLVWELPAGRPYDQPVLPGDSAFLAYRAAVRADGADLERPVADRPEPATPEEAAIWRDEDFNADLAHGGSAGTIAPITCLDALLFAHQNRRVSQLERPTEFIASVLVREAAETPAVAVVFGAGEEMFP